MGGGGIGGSSAGASKQTTRSSKDAEFTREGSMRARADSLNETSGRSSSREVAWEARV